MLGDVEAGPQMIEKIHQKLKDNQKNIIRASVFKKL